MFENLSDKLQRAFKNLRGEGTVTEENINDALREIRVALLEADVNLSVVKEMIEHVREKAIPKSTLSQHFKILREAGLIRSVRKGVELKNEANCCAETWSPRAMAS